MDEPDILIAEIDKNASETLHIAIREWKGHRFIDFRLFYKSGTEMKPSGKGFGLKPELLAELRQAVEQAEVEARRLGLLQNTAFSDAAE